MICRECGAKMYLDDKDYNFSGTYLGLNSPLIESIEKH